MNAIRNFIFKYKNDPKFRLIGLVIISLYLIVFSPFKLIETNQIFGEKRFESQIFEDKIPLIDAVKNECLISNIEKRGDDLSIGPNKEIHEFDNLLRSLLIACRVSKVRNNSGIKNNVIVTFRNKSERENTFFESIPYYNQIEKIEVNSELVYELNNVTNGFNATQDSVYLSPELSIVKNLKGISYPKNPERIFNRVCSLKYRVSEDDFEFDKINGLENTIKVAQISANLCGEESQKSIVCPISGYTCHDNKGFLVDCSSPLSRTKIQTHINFDFANIVGTDTSPMSLDRPIDSDIAFPLSSFENIDGNIIWLLLRGQTQTSIANYNPRNDPNCSSEQEIAQIEALRSGENRNGFNEFTRQNITCLDKKLPFSHIGAFSGFSACSQGENMMYPNYSKPFGRCEAGYGFDTITKGSQRFSVTTSYASGTGFGIIWPTKQCFSTIGVAN